MTAVAHDLNMAAFCLMLIAENKYEVNWESSPPGFTQVGTQVVTITRPLPLLVESDAPAMFAPVKGARPRAIAVLSMETTPPTLIAVADINDGKDFPMDTLGALAIDHLNLAAS